MALVSSPDNIRWNGTGRAYAGAVAGSTFDELGDLEVLTFGMAVATEKVKTNRNAAKATILEVETERDATVTFGLREMTNGNLKMSMLASEINTLNQSADSLDMVETTMTDDLYVDLGKLNIFSTKISGVITGTIDIGDTLTGDVSGNTGKVAWTEAGLVELIDVSGSFATDSELTVATPGAITTVGIEVLEDPVVVDLLLATTRYVNGTDYSVDPDYGYIRKLSTGSIGATAFVNCDHEAVTKKYIWAMAAGSVTKKIIFVSDKDDVGIRTRWTFHKIQINLDGEFPLIGAGGAILNVKGTVLADTTQASGQEYYKVEMIG